MIMINDIDSKPKDQTVNSVSFFAYAKVITNVGSSNDEINNDCDAYKSYRLPNRYVVWTNYITKKIHTWDGNNEKAEQLPENLSPVKLKMKLALEYLNSDEAKKRKCNIINDYDYAWILKAIEIQPSLGVLERFLGYTELINLGYDGFIDIIQELGFTRIGKRNLQRFYKYAPENKLPLTFNDLEDKLHKNSEAQRRNNIISTFLKIMNMP